MHYFAFFSDIPELNGMLYGIPQNAEFSELQNIVHVGKNYDSMPDLVEDLEHIYCGTMSVEFMHMKVLIIYFLTWCMPTYDIVNSFLSVCSRCFLYVQLITEVQYDDKNI